MPSPNPTGVCALCLQTAVLQESHLLPKSVYKHIRAPQALSPHPVMFSFNAEIQSAMQAKQYLLCSDCEQRFHRHGEDWTMGHSARQTGEFEIRKKLLAHGGQQKLLDDVHVFYTAAIPSVNADALCYFALSVIWRAAVASWRIGGLSLEQLSLGKYEQAVRLFLLGKASFPSNIAMMAVVSSLPDPRLMVTLPRSKKHHGYTSHFFAIPGLDFTVDIGGQIPGMLKAMCLHHGVRRPLFYSPVADIENATSYLRQKEMRERQGRVAQIFGGH